jgi:ATP/maltotriose-dependent transcriptional regulator MalT/DNA-binding SARP family transcriptional activator
MQTSASGPIDTRRVGFLSYAPPFDEKRQGMEELGVSLEPEIDDRLLEEMARVRSCFPLRSGKIQRPCLPEETLRRDRLFDWLDARSGRRVVYVIAEAGFGKTTLIADFLRRSQLRTFWYRLDEDDTDSLVFIRYLVAACQAVDPRLFARSATLLADSSLEPTREDAILDTFFTEIGGLGEMPSVLVLDDFHLVESVPSIGSLLERLIARAPEALKLIVASRRTPSLSVAGLRARGELAELGREELRFDECETGRLFRDSYNHPLEPDVLHDLQARTDGWAASLQLVRTAVDGRSAGQVRAFVHSLSGAEGELYDYLAEEVVGDLEPEIRSFLVRTAILEDIEPDTAAVAAGVAPARSRRLLSEAQRLGLMSRGGDQGSTWRPHPLVREFLLAHLEAELGRGGVAEMHRQLAAVLEPRSWRLAARHWAAAGDADEVRRVVCAATPTIIGTGDLAAADEFVARFPDPKPNPWFDIIRARRLFALGRYREAREEARRLQGSAAISASTDTSLALAVSLTLLNLGTELDDGDMRTAAVDVLRRCDDRELASIARATEALYQAAEEGRLDSLRDLLLETLHLNREQGHSRYEGISLLNLSNAQRSLDNPQAVIAAGTEAIRILRSAGNCWDLAAAHLNIAKGLAHIGHWQEAQSHIQEAIDETDQTAKPEVVSEAAELEAMYGDPARGLLILGRVFSESERRRDDPFCRYVAARIALEHDSPDRAAELLRQIVGEALVPGFRSARISLDLQVRSTANPSDPDLQASFEAALRSAQSQQAWFWWKNIRLTQALVSPSDALADHLRSLEPGDAAYLSIQAELVLRRLADLTEPAFGTVRTEASLRPERWRWALRRFFSEAGHSASNVRRAADLLEIVGDLEDVPILAALRQKRALHLPDAGRALNRRLAPRVYVEDLGRVAIRIDERTIPGTDIRKKILSLLCFLLTRPQFTATREQVLEALWPEMEPEAGANSLNQSVYFLRRVFEPGCEDDTSAGYLRSRADLIWLDQDLVQSRSAHCLKLIAAIRRDPSPELVTRLAESYTGRFGVDFIYDDWASSFRDTLHASFLDRIERAVTLDTEAGAFDRALSVAQLALQADPDAEQIELCLLRVYRRTNANAAAAEQYAHYASVMREQLGVEPLPLEAI